MSYLEYSAMQLDTLREVGNIGAGNAATALSQVINKKINMSVPSVNIIKINDIILKLDGEKLAIGVIVRVLGDAPGNILYVFDRDSAIETINNLIGSNDNYVSEMGNSVLSEIVNIISNSYLTAIVNLTGLELQTSVPAIAEDMFSAILSTSFIESEQYDEQVIDIITEMYNEDNFQVTGHLFYIPNPGSLEKILLALGMS